VAVDSRKKRDGAFLAHLGTYDPMKHQIVKIDHDGIDAWVAKGAQCSPSVRKLVKMSKRGSEAAAGAPEVSSAA